MPDRSPTRTVTRAAGRACALRRWRAVRAASAVLLLQTALLLGFLGAPAAAAEPVKAEITVNMSGGYAGIVSGFSEEIDADVRMANNVLVISFKTPVSAAIDRLSLNAAGYASAARSDPDRMGVRLALSRKVTLNSMMAGERLFVDLLPDTWTAAPPGLPQEVVEELAKRAREAEKKERQQRVVSRERQVPPTPARVAHWPPSSRYVFASAASTPLSPDSTTAQ